MATWDLLDTAALDPPNKYGIGNYVVRSPKVTILTFFNGVFNFDCAFTSSQPLGRTARSKRLLRTYLKYKVMFSWYTVYCTLEVQPLPRVIGTWLRCKEPPTARG